jgi:hypothetical protein
MKTRNFLVLIVLLSAFSVCAFAQSTLPFKRTTYKSDRLDFGVGGTLAVVGAPSGSIRIEGWSNREIEISAEIELQANSEADLDRISKVTGFVLEESLGRTGIISIGTHDRKTLKRADKKFPKALMNLPFKIDYVIKVPRYCDLQIDGGKGDLAITGVEGTMKINYLESNAKIDLVGGGINATFGSGKVEVNIATRSWRGRWADVQIATGSMNVSLPAGLNADFDAAILRTGAIENSFPDFKPRVRKGEFTEKSIVAKSGTGSVPLKFTVGDGTMKITESGRPG